MWSCETRCYWSRAITLSVPYNYESDFHIDIVPCIELNDRFLIMNRKDNTYEETDANGYAQWFTRKNDIVGSDHLIDVVKLVKFIRDRKSIPIKSVLLTTLLGEQVRDGDQRNAFTDLPTTLQILFGRLDDYLQSLERMPEVHNPALPSETFMRHWDQEKFAESKEKMHAVRTQIDAAFCAPNPENSVEKWRSVFGL